MNDASLRRLRRLLLLLPAAARAGRRGRGVPLASAVELTGAAGEAELLADIAAVHGLWVEPGLGDEVIDLYVEDGEVHVTYALAFGAPRALSLAEGAVLLAALQPFEAEGGKPVRDAARKLRRAIPDPLRAEADRLARGLDLALVPPGPWAGALREAIARRVETAIEYRAANEEAVSRRTVEPRVLLHRDGRWYLAAWNVDKGEEHLFRLDRMVTVEPGTRVFAEHRGPPLARYGRRTLFFASGAERPVTVRYTGAAARAVRERRPEGLAEAAGGAVEVTQALVPGPHLFGVVLGHGGLADVAGPPDVAAAFQARVAELQRLYAGAAQP